MKQFWNFGKLGEIILPVEQTNEMVKLTADILKAVREDRQARYD